MTCVFSLQNSNNSFPASFYIPRLNFLVIPGVSLLPTFAFEYPITKRTSFVCFEDIMYVFIELFNFYFFSITSWGIDLDYQDIEWFALETNRDHSVVFEIASKYCFSDSS